MLANVIFREILNRKEDYPLKLAMPTSLQQKLNSDLLASLQLNCSTSCAATLSHLTNLLCGTNCLVKLGMTFKLLLCTFNRCFRIKLFLYQALGQ